jgi:hypothetical protein
VKDGNHLIQEISCLEDALEFLYEWPQSRRGPIYHTALRACQKVYEGNYTLSAAGQPEENGCPAGRLIRSAGE